LVHEKNPLRTEALLLLGAIYYQVWIELFSMECEQLIDAFVSLGHLQCNFLVVLFSQLHDYDMCIKKNEEALRIDPDFAECYGNMANAWKVNTVL
jgi:protein O-GlcNAc transferase